MERLLTPSMASFRPAASAVACLLVAVALVRAASFIKEKPSFLTTCYFSDPKFDQCTVQVMRVLFSKLVDGFPEIGALPLDPLDITEIKMTTLGNGPVSMDSTMYNVKITGLSKVNVLSHKIDKKTSKIETSLFIPKLLIEGAYKLKGRILVLPLNGNGDVYIEPRNMNVTSKFDMSLKQHDGHRFLHVDGAKVDFTIGGLKMSFTNLYNGQKNLEDSTNQYLNENWEVALESIKPVLAETIEDLMKNMLGRLLDKVPAEFFIGDI